MNDVMHEQYECRTCGVPMGGRGECPQGHGGDPELVQYMRVDERLKTAIETFREYETAGWTMVALPPDIASQIIGLPASQQNAFAFMGNLKAKIQLLEMTNPAGGGWRVVDSASEGWVLLAHPDYDGPTGHRLAVPVVSMEGSEVQIGGPELEQKVMQVFPCRRCGWEHACEDEGGCHS